MTTQVRILPLCRAVLSVGIIALFWPCATQAGPSNPPPATAKPLPNKGVRRAAPKAETDRAGQTPRSAERGSGVGPSGKGRRSGAAGVAEWPANAITVRSLIVQKRLPEALRVAETVLKRHPNDLEVAMQRARLLFWLGKPKVAEKAAIAVYKRERRNFAALRLVGDIRQQRGDKRGAIRAYREAQLRGDPDVVLAIRLISLYLDIRESTLALAQVRPGMELPSELAFRLSKGRYPWRIEAWGGMTAFNGQQWRRGMFTTAYTWSPKLTLLGGATVEDRGSGRVGVQAVAQLFFSTDKVTGDARIAWSPQPGGFLPPVDAWAEAAYQFSNRFSVGLWGRYASYQVSSLYTIGPYVPINFGRLTVKPGYLLVVRGATVAGDLGQVGHTVFLRTRWDHNIRTAFFVWLYYGQEAVFNNRTVYGADESGPSAVVGWDQWLGQRFGFRLMGTAYRPMELNATMWDLIAAVRVRL
ncbi:MAG: tetratricopeptide repeat protein [Myxococcales bacterium]|nr:tetratricopeptide repeat protein [Myxococcales bacterium]